MTIQAIVRNTQTVSVTFTGKPSREVLQRLKNAGFRYEKGNWFNSQTTGKLISETEVESDIAA